MSGCSRMCRHRNRVLMSHRPSAAGITNPPPWLCIEGNGMRPSHMGVGMALNQPMYTLNTTEVHAVMFEEEEWK